MYKVGRSDRMKYRRYITNNNRKIDVHVVALVKLF